jgi:ribosome-associated heat shock protein Hsp15
MPAHESRREADAAAARIRFDVWLWAARFYKSRSLATQGVAAGQARLNGERVKPAHAVREGDSVLVRKDGLEWDVVVLALSDRRGPAPVAAGLYRETEASAVARAEALRLRQAANAGAPRFAGRPTKRDRRRLADVIGDG